MNALKITTVEPFPGVFSVTLDGPLDTYTHETLDVELYETKLKILDHEEAAMNRRAWADPVS